MDEKTNNVEIPKDLEGYIIKGINDYRWSDEFLVKELSRFGIDEHSAKVLIADVHENHDVSNKESLFQDESDNGKVTGIFAVICYFALAGGILSFVQGIKDYENTTSGIIDIANSTLYALLALYAVVRVRLKKPDGIFLMKSFLIICFFSNLIFFFVYSKQGGVSTSRMIRTMIMCIVFFLYFCSSDQVKQLFPKKKRMVPWYDRFFVGLASIPTVMILSLLLLFIVDKGIQQTNADSTSTEQLETVELKKHAEKVVKHLEASMPVKIDDYASLIGFDYDDDDFRYCTINMSLEISRNEFSPEELKKILNEYATAVYSMELVIMLKQAEVTVFLHIIDKDGEQIYYDKIG